MCLKMSISFKHLSTYAMLGKFLVLFGSGLKIVGILISFALIETGAAYTPMFVVGDFYLPLGGLLASVLSVIIILNIAGLGFALLALWQMSKGRIKAAAYHALISCMLAPLDLILFIAAILLFISPEAKKRSLFGIKKR